MRYFPDFYSSYTFGRIAFGFHFSFITVLRNR